jgi:BirA family transcriptional regulator, biotin operon repressor / biotin---[acetyl-CoA-carboxylase] ligase
MIPMAEPLDPTTIANALRTAALPRTVRCLGSVGSTMDVARELLGELGRSELPLLVTAEEQTAGRGRVGRRWEAPAGSALLLSLALRPTWLPPARGVALVWMLAVALCEAVEELTPLRARLKWPNDLLLPATGGASHAKAAGILLEANLGAGRIEWAILGCGVNVSAAPPAAQTRYPATSLAAAAGAPVDRTALLLALLRRLDAWHGRLQAGEEAALFAAWRGRLAGIGAPVRVETPGGR